MTDHAREDLDLVIAHIPEVADHIRHVDADGDLEDFWEDVARTAAAIRAASTAEATFTPVAADHDWTCHELAQRLGPVAASEEIQHAHDPLLDHRILADYGGRWMARAGIGEPGELDADEDAVVLLHQRARRGVRRAMVKLATRKSGVFTVELDTSMDQQAVREALFDSVDGWELIRLEGQRGSLLIQDWIPMTYEHRLFVVDGEVVSSAGCIEEFTPYSRQNTSTRFDSRMRRVRGDAAAGEQSSPITSKPPVLGRYLETGGRIAAQHGGTVVIDLALDASSGEIVVVELNPLPNAGLYACHVDAVYRALISAEDRGYSAYAHHDPRTVM